MPGETKTFRIYLEEVENLTDINKTIQELTKAPAIDITSTACEKSRTIDFSVLADENVTVKGCLPDGTSTQLQP